MPKHSLTLRCVHYSFLFLSLFSLSLLVQLAATQTTTSMCQPTGCHTNTQPHHSINTQPHHTTSEHIHFPKSTHCPIIIQTSIMQILESLFSIGRLPTHMKREKKKTNYENQGGNPAHRRREKRNITKKGIRKERPHREPGFQSPAMLMLIC